MRASLMSLQDGEAGTEGNGTPGWMRALQARVPPHAVVLVLLLLLAFGTRALRCGRPTVTPVSMRSIPD